MQKGHVPLELSEPQLVNGATCGSGLQTLEDPEIPHKLLALAGKQGRRFAGACFRSPSAWRGLGCPPLRA